jgi:hypothetical protein
MKEDFISSSMAMGIRLPEKGAAPSALIGRSYTKDAPENSLFARREIDGAEGAITARSWAANELVRA